MPFQPINFANIEPQGNEFFRNLVQNLSQGVGLGAQIRDIPRDARAKELANQLNQYKVDRAPQEFQEGLQSKMAERVYKEALARKMNAEAELPFGGRRLTGPAGIVQSLEELAQQYGKDSSVYSNAEKYFNSQLRSMNSNSKRADFLSNSSNLRGLPADEKSRVSSTAVSMGYDPIEASQLINQGYTLKDLARFKGIKLEEVDPSFALTSSQRSQQGNRKGFVAEISNLEKNVAKPMSKVSRKFMKYSPAQLYGVISGSHSADEQGKILAARSLQPELASLRLKAAGAGIGIEGIRDMQDKMLGKLKIMESLVSPEAYIAMSKYTDKWLNEAVEAYNNSLSEGSKLGTIRKKESSSGSEEKRIRIPLDQL